jgi:hypothetical protein
VQDPVEQRQAGAGAEGRLGFAGVAVGKARPAGKSVNFYRVRGEVRRRRLGPAAPWRRRRAEPFDV